MIKRKVNFDTYSLSNLYNILKAHESKVKEFVDETNKMNFGGPLALVSKTTFKYVCSDYEGGDGEEGFLINSDYEVWPIIQIIVTKSFTRSL